MDDLLSGKGRVAADPLAQPAKDRLAKRKAGRPRSGSSGDARSGGDVGGADGGDFSPADAELLQEALIQLYDPKNLQAFVSMYPNYMLWRTGHRHWQVTEGESAAMTGPLSVVLRLWVQVHPKWMALCLAIVNIGSIYGQKLMQERMIQLQAENERLTQEAANKPKTA